MKPARFIIDTHAHPQRHVAGPELFDHGGMQGGNMDNLVNECIQVARLRVDRGRLEG